MVVIYAHAEWVAVTGNRLMMPSSAVVLQTGLGTHPKQSRLPEVSPAARKSRPEQI